MIAQATYIDLAWWQVAIAALLVLTNGAVSLVLRLGIERRLLVAATRMTLQLALLGLVLEQVFAIGKWYLVLVILLLMTWVASIAAVRRTSYRFPGIFGNSFVAICASSWVVTTLALTAVVQVEPWYRPQYAIPLLGMILGNTLNGISLGLDRLARELETGRDRVESLLALGATRWEAARAPVREALRTGLIPILNSMMIAGIVSLPGMMTGQLLAGVAPRSAVKYQIVIFFLVAAATALGTTGVVLLGYLRLFDRCHRLRSRAIRKIGGRK